MNKDYDVIVVGAGPAGLLAAGRAASMGAKVLILEKMPSEGRKLLITGSGRCNVTNGATNSEFINHVFPDGRFLRHALKAFNSTNILQLLDKYGVKTIIGPNGRFFPASDKAKDVLTALLQWTSDQGVEIRKGERVEKILTDNSKVIGVKSNGKSFMAGAVILATGGKSYPLTGSTGDGYELANQLGHTIEKPLPALVSLETAGGIAQKLQGLNLKDVNASLWVNNKKIHDLTGEMLFTHFGLSGPIILTLSRFAVNPLQNREKVEVSLDLVPSLKETELDIKLIQDLNNHGKKKIINLLHNWLPASMAPLFIELLMIDADKVCHQISGNERKKIAGLLKNFKIPISHNRSFKEAIITAGGLILSEISPKSMESTIISGLYFAGELINLDAETGGYNLQIAYSTGWLAGESSAKYWKSK
jgi:predicted Rossmann fold flavoprotein